MDNTDSNVVSHNLHWLYKIGGIAFLLEGIAYLVISVTGIMIGVTPGNSVKWLNAITLHPGLSIATYVVFTGIADLVLIPGTLALYFALRKFNQTAMLIATGILLAYVAIDISTFVTNSYTITILTQNYTGISDQVQRAAILGAETYGLATIPLSQFFGWFFPSFGYLIIALIVRGKKLGKFVFILGVLAGVSDIAGSFAFLSPGTFWDSFLTPGLALLGLFALSVGWMLIRINKWPSSLEPQKAS